MNCCLNCKNKTYEVDETVIFCFKYLFTKIVGAYECEDYEMDIESEEETK